MIRIGDPTNGVDVRDAIYVAITVAFFALCTGLVRGCDALLGPDELDAALVDGHDGDEHRDMKRSDRDQPVDSVSAR